MRWPSCIALILIFCNGANAFAQQAGSIRGMVRDKDFDAPLPVADGPALPSLKAFQGFDEIINYRPILNPADFFLGKNDGNEVPLEKNDIAFIVAQGHESRI